MARLFAYYALDISNLNLNRLVSGYYDSQFSNNDYLTVGDYTYEDTLGVVYYSGGYASSLFGGRSFAFDQNGNLSSGTVTGYLQGFYSGTTPIAWWGIENFTYSAAGMYNAALTSSTADDYSIISSILAGGDQFYLSSYADRVNGYAGNDYFYAGAGKDVLDGGTGTDTADYSEKTSAVKVTLNKSTNVTVYINGAAEVTIKNTESINGGSAADQLTGDTLANTLKGNGGNDILKGGAGKDTLTGGSGRDYFDFDLVSDSGITSTTRDVIKDFNKAQGDKIDLRTIDAKAGYTSNDGFTFISSDPTNNTASQASNGKLWYASGVLYGSTDTDKAAEFTIEVTLSGISTTNAADYILL